MPQSTNTPSVVERLLELTQIGRLTWTYLYSDYPEVNSPDDYQAATRPNAYVLEDEHYGFGVVVLYLGETEHDSPKLHIQGDEVDCSPMDRMLLAEAVREFFREVQTGAIPNRQEQFQEAVQRRVAPLEEQLKSESRRAGRDEMLLTRQMDVTDRLSEALLHLATSNTPDQIEDEEMRLPLTPESFVSVASALGFDCSEVPGEHIQQIIGELALQYALHPQP